MTTATTKNKRHPAAELLVDNVRIFLQIQSAFAECDEDVKEAVGEMVEVFNDEEATEGERSRALLTIVDALYPGLAVDFLNSSQRARSQPGAKEAATKMTVEEANFADRLEALMKERGLTQEQLAEKAGVGQSAISNMLNRQCRPQRRTIAKMAGALGVETDALWPM